MEGMKEQAQAFMNTHNLKQCYECDGLLYKHEHNAIGRKQMSGKEVITHTANAGASTEKQED